VKEVVAQEYGADAGADKTKLESAMISVNAATQTRSGAAIRRDPELQNPKLQNEPNWDNRNIFNALERMLSAAFAD
jgi:hypothetical protein